MVAAIRAGKANTDYTALRAAYVKDKSYDPYGVGVSALSGQMSRAFRGDDCKTAIATANQIASIRFVDLDAHFIAASCLDKAGDKAHADMESAIFVGLGRSILRSGDGKSPETAFHVVTLAEEYFVLGLKDVAMERQALIRAGDHSYDLITGKIKGKGTKAEYYFEIDKLQAAEAKALHGK